MSASTQRRVKEIKSNSYPGTPQKDKVKVNLTEAFSSQQPDVTLTPTSQQESAYKTALEHNSSSEDDYIQDAPIIPLGTNKIESTPEKTVIDSNCPQNVICEMEILRDQIRTMLNQSIDGDSPNFMNISNTSSIDTIALLRSALPQSSPELQLDENGILMSSANSNGYSRRTSTRQTSPAAPDSSLAAENTILKENIEKERFRRKHCEAHIHQLQDQLLECQEQLAVARSVEKKKEIMIGQLDKTLANVVEGWKKQDHEKQKLINSLKDEKQDLELMQQTHDAILQKFEEDLADTVKALQYEQSKQIETDANYRNVCEEFEQQLSSLKKQITELQNANLMLEEEKGGMLKNKENLLMEKDTIIQNYNQEFKELKSLHDQVTEELSDVKTESNNALNELQSLLEEAHKELECLHKTLKEEENKSNKLKTELNAVRKEKENLALANSLLQTKFEAVKTKQDSEMRAQLEEQFNTQIYEIQKQIAKTETELRQAQKKQLSELSNQHHEDMEQQKQRFQADIKKKDEQHSKSRIQYEERLRLASNEITALSNSHTVLEAQRNELINRVKGLMQQHWNETVSLFSADKQHRPRGRPPKRWSEHIRSDTNLPMLTAERLARDRMRWKQAVLRNVARLSGAQTINDAHNQLSSTIRSDFSTGCYPTPKVSHLYPQSMPPTSNGPYFDLRVYNNESQANINTNPFMNGSHETIFSGAKHEHSFSIPPRPSDNNYVDSLHTPQPLQKSGIDHNHRNITAVSSSATRHFLHHDLQQSSHYRPVASTPPRYPRLEVPHDSMLSTGSNAHTMQQTPHQIVSQYQSNVLSSQFFQGLQEDSQVVKNVATRRNSDVLQNTNRVPAKHQEDPISLLYQDVDEDDDCSTSTDDHDVTKTHVTDQRMHEQEEKQERLTHFIEKLLQRSPGQPTNEASNEFTDTIGESVQRVLQQTAQQKQTTNQTAFKKSVLRDQPNASQNTKVNMENKPSSPEKKKSLMELDKKQLIDLKAILHTTSETEEEKIMQMLQNFVRFKELEEAPVHQQPSHQTANERLQKVHSTHVRKSTISSEAKQHGMKKAQKSTKLNKNVATKEERKRRDARQPSSSKANNAWK